MPRNDVCSRILPPAFLTIQEEVQMTVFANRGSVPSAYDGLPRGRDGGIGVLT